MLSQSKLAPRLANGDPDVARHPARKHIILVVVCGIGGLFLPSFYNCTQYKRNLVTREGTDRTDPRRTFVVAIQQHSSAVRGILLRQIFISSFRL